jgi:hypothetical protein
MSAPTPLAKRAQSRPEASWSKLDSLREQFVDTVPLMWDHPEFDDDADDWEPLRLRRARPIRVLAILVVIAMVLALVIPVLLSSLQDDEPDETRPDGVRAAVVVEHPSITSST